MSDVSPDPEKQADRRLQLRLGLIGVGTSILVAVAGLGGVYLGTHLQGQAQEKTIAAQRHQASLQYLRDQRRQAYGDLLGANRQLLSREQDLILPVGGDFSGATDRLVAQARLARRDYFRTVDLVGVVGPTDLLASVQQLTTAHVKAAQAIDDLRAHPQPTAGEKREYADAMHRCWSETTETGDEFRLTLQANQ